MVRFKIILETIKDFNLLESAELNGKYLLEKISKLDGFKLFKNKRDFIKEFVVETKFLGVKIKEAAEKKGFLFDSVDKHLIKFSFTEKRTKEDIEKLIEFLKLYLL